MRRRIAPRGLFLVLDRFDYEPFVLAPEYAASGSDSNQRAPKGQAPEEHASETPLSFEEYRARYAAKTDYPGSVEEYLRLDAGGGLRRGLPLHMFNRALIAARPTSG